jgi:membrane-associated phospholipid phosphatase
LHGGEAVTTIVETDQLCLDRYFYAPVWSYVGDLYQDNWYFYSRRSLLKLGASVGIAAALANTSGDQEFRDWFQDNVATAEENWEWAKHLGEAWITPPFLLAVWAIDEWAPPYGAFREYLWTPEFGYWSRQSLRALVVGLPVVALLQVTTGASRPGEAEYGSRWRPFRDNNGASGHAFIGAVPFLVAAKRTDHLLLKTAFFAGSGLAGFSRLNDDAHYLSQVLLGWSVACLAVEATTWTERSKLQYRIVPVTIDGLIGVGVETRY